MCDLCHVFGHHTNKCPREASTSSIPLQPAAQVWTRVGNGKQKVGCDHSNQGQQIGLGTNPTTTGPQRSSTPIKISITHLPGEELSDSEEELLEVLEGVVSSNQGAESAASLEVRSPNSHNTTGLHGLNSEKVTNFNNQSDSTPAPLFRSAAKKAAKIRFL